MLHVSTNHTVEDTPVDIFSKLLSMKNKLEETIRQNTNCFSAVFRGVYLLIISHKAPS